MKIPSHYVDRLKKVVATPLPHKDSVDQYSLETRSYTVPPVVAWLAQARTALEAIFPPGHAVLKDWAELTRDGKHGFIPHNRTHVESAQALVGAAIEIVEAGDLHSVVDGVRSETTLELLEQAEGLNERKHHVAAAVLAGGALETHLRHLCDRENVTFNTPGCISNYNNAIAGHAKTGPAIYSPNDVKLVTAWGGFRNLAAHQPIDFEKEVDKATVRNTINAIREFIARTT